MIFSSRRFLQKMNELILLYYYETSGRLVFVRFLEEIGDTKKTFRNYLTFKETLFFNSILGSDIQRACSNAINRVLRRRVASKNASEKLENRLTMKDLHECMKRVTPMSHQWRKKYDHWCKQVIRKKKYLQKRKNDNLSPETEL